MLRGLRQHQERAAKIGADHPIEYLYAAASPADWRGMASPWP